MLTSLDPVAAFKVSLPDPPKRVDETNPPVSERLSFPSPAARTEDPIEAVMSMVSFPEPDLTEALSTSLATLSVIVSLPDPLSRVELLKV